MDKLLLWHPLLFLIIFVIMPFTQYAGLIPPAQFVMPFIVVCTFSLFLYFIIKYIVRKEDAAMAVLSPVLIVLFNYGTLYEYISSLTRGTQLKVPVLGLTTIIILFGLIVYFVKVKRAHEFTIKKVNKVFFIIAAALIFLNTFNITLQSFAIAKINRLSETSAIPKLHLTGPLPDIYFVILDEYAAPSQMKSYFQHDMKPFVEYLNKKGFMVTEMHTKHLSTAAIMDSRLNMEDINTRDSALSTYSLSDSLLESINILNSYEEEKMIRIRNNKVIGFLKSIGYRYVHMGSWFAHTQYNRLADENINCFGFQFKDELSAIIASRSILRLVFINRYFHRQAVFDAFAVMENMTVIPAKPKFVFAHIISPHAPYIFRANGEKLGVNPGNGRSEKQLYLDQHIWVTKKVKEFVDKKLSSSQTAPVIIIQADHGARMDRMGARHVFNAVYMPYYKGDPWPDYISSSNTFRLLLKEFWGSNLEFQL